MLLETITIVCDYGDGETAICPRRSIPSEQVLHVTRWEVGGKPSSQTLAPQDPQQVLIRPTPEWCRLSL
jgi:hypothetical protein